MAAVSVLLVDGDDSRRQLLRERLADRFVVHEASSVEAGRAALFAHAVDVLIVSSSLPDGCGLNVLSGDGRASSPAPTILVTNELTPTRFRKAQHAGVIRFLQPEDLALGLDSALEDALSSRGGMRGEVYGLSLIDLLQMYHYAQRTVRLHVRGFQAGHIDMRGGELTDAVVNDLSGAEALRALLAYTEATVSTVALPDSAPLSLDTPFESLLLDSLRLFDEASHDESDSFGAMYESVSPPPESVTTLTKKGVDAALIGVFETTFGKLYGGAEVALFKAGEEGIWLFTDDRDQAPPRPWMDAAALVKQPLPSWRWVARFSPHHASALLRFGENDDVACVSGRHTSKAAAGAFQIAVMRAYEQLRHLDAHLPIARRDDSARDLAPPSTVPQLDQFCERACTSLLRAVLVRQCAILDAADGRVVGRSSPGAVDAMPAGAWDLVWQTISGPLGRSLSSPETLPGSSSAVVSAEQGLVFAVPLGEDFVLAASTDHAVNAGMIGIRMRLVASSFADDRGPA
ncbi:MAG: DUF4388 domain-containing protein [Myxococcota bacterium]